MTDGRSVRDRDDLWRDVRWSAALVGSVAVLLTLAGLFGPALGR